MSGFTLTPVIVAGSAGLTTLSQRLTFSLRFFKGLAKTLYVLPVLIRVLPIFPDLTYNKTVRGLATDVSNYNTLRGEQVSVLKDNPNYNEERYANAIAPLLEERGFPSQFIIDQGRAGVAEIKTAGDDWCNIAGAGIGLRPSTDTGNTLIDSIVWGTYLGKKLNLSSLIQELRISS